MSGRNWRNFLNNNFVFLTGIPLIIGIHWGWWRIQQNTDLVDFKSDREFPLYKMYKDVSNKLFGNSLNDDSTNSEHMQSSEK